MAPFHYAISICYNVCMNKPSMTLSEQLKNIDPHFYLAASEELMHDLQRDINSSWKETMRRSNDFPFLAEVVKAFIKLSAVPNIPQTALERMAGMRFALEALIACAESLAVTNPHNEPLA